MWRKDSPQNVIDSFRKRQQLLPVIISVLALLLVIIGVAIIILWISGGGFSMPFIGRRPTPTSKLPPTPVMSPTPSLEPTETPTPTVTISPTPNAPFEYEVKENDNCYEIAVKYNVDLQTLLAINNFPDGTCPIIPGQKILVPAPGQLLPTQTPLALEDIAIGTRYEYTIQAGDSLQTIASKFNSTIDDILNLNKTKITNPDILPPGLVIVVRVNIVTPTATFAPTSTLSF
jgi:LysM repeat protein